MQLSILRVPSSFEMMNAMPVTLEQPAFESARPRSVFIPRFISTIVLWSIALAIAFSGYEVFFWLLISAFGLIALLEFYRMLDHRGLPNFKITGLICGAILLAGSFHYFSTVGPASSYDFEVAVLLFFLLTVFGRQMFARLRDDEPLQTDCRRADSQALAGRTSLGAATACPEQAQGRHRWNRPSTDYERSVSRLLSMLRDARVARTSA